MSIQKDCMTLILKKLELKIEMSPDEYYCEIMELDKKYPGKGFRQAAEAYANKLRQIEKQKNNVVDQKSRASGEREPGEED